MSIWAMDYKEEIERATKESELAKIEKEIVEDNELTYWDSIELVRLTEERRKSLR